MKRWFLLVLLFVVLIGLLLETSFVSSEINSALALDSVTIHPTIDSQTFNPPDDPFFDKQWALTKMRVPQAWQITEGSPEVIIAILDTGIDKDHKDLVGSVIAEVNFGDSNTVKDIDGHGTHIAGIIAGNTNNKLGIAGISSNSRLLSVKITDDTGVFLNSDVLTKGIIWAVDKGAKVINISLTCRQPSAALKNAIDYAWERGVVIVAASNELELSGIIYPASYQNCLAVASTNQNDLMPSWAENSDWIDVMAPGAKIYSTLPNNSYSYKSGDSCAAAQVSGLAALLFSVVTDENNNGFLNDEVRAIIESSGVDINIGGINKKRIDAFDAVNKGITLKEYY
jgi:thermitase